MPQVSEAEEGDLRRPGRRAREHVVLGEARDLAHRLEDAELWTKREWVEQRW